MTLLTNTLSALWQVILVGLLFGAGLPAIFALGLRALDSGTTDSGTTESGTTEAADGTGGTPTRTGRIAGGLCFLIVLTAIAGGILMLMSDFLATTFGIHVF